MISVFWFSVCMVAMVIVCWAGMIAAYCWGREDARKSEIP